MDFKELVRTMRSNAILIVCIWSAVVVLTLVYTYLQTPRYTASTLLYITSSELSGDTTKAYQGNLLSEQKVDSYVSLVSSDRIRLDVARQTGLPIEEGIITASAQPDTVLLTISSTFTSAQQSASIADSAANSFVALVAELERPANPSLPPSVRANIVLPALVPDEPSSPSYIRTPLLGVLLGAILALVSSVVRSALDTRIRSTNQLHEAASAPVIGDIERWSGVDSNLPVRDEPMSRAAEEFNRIRTNMAFLQSASKSRSVSFTSCLPGEGKSTTASNVALALAKAGEEVLLVDADLRRPQLGAMFAIDSAVGLTTVLTGRVALPEATTRVARGLAVLPSGLIPPNPNELLGSQRMQEMLEEAGRRFTYVLIDCPPLLPVADAATLANTVDSVILVCKATVTTTAQVERALTGLAAVEKAPAAAIFTFSTPTRAEKYYREYYGSELPKDAKESQTGDRQVALTDNIALKQETSRPTPHARAAQQSGSIAPGRLGDR